MLNFHRYLRAPRGDGLWPSPHPYALLAIVLLHGCAYPSPSPTKPLAVQVGGYLDDDACLAVGRPVQREVHTRELKVHTRPDHQSPLAGTVEQDGFFWMCDNSEDGEWTGILFAIREDRQIACGVSGTIEERRDYSGPCLQGWVPSEAIVLYAG